MEIHPRLSLDPADFSRFTRGSCRWFTGSGWKKGRIQEIHPDRLSVRSESPTRTVVIYDARNVEQ